MNRKLELILVIGLFILGALVRVSYFENSHNLFSVEAEGYSKIQLMLQWDQSPLLYPDTNFGPLHMPLLKWPWKLSGSLIMANQIVSLILGLLLLPLTYLLARKLFGVAPALGTLAFLTMSMLPVKTSTVTLAEGPTVFFLVFGTYLATIYVEKSDDQWWAFVGSAIAFSAMSALRFETWLFLPLICLWMILRRGFVRGTVYTSILALFPFTHLYICYDKMGDSFHFLKTSAAITAMNSAKVDVARRAWGFIDSLIYTCSWPVIILLPAGLILIFATGNSNHMWQQLVKIGLRHKKGAAKIVNGVVSVLARKRGTLIGLMLIAILGVYEYKAIKATLAPELFRYLTVPSVLIALVWPLPITELGRVIFKKENLVVVVAVLVCGLYFGSISYKSVVREERLMEPAMGVYKMLDELRPTLKNEDRIFIGSEYHPVIVVESGLVWENFRLPVYPDNANASVKSVKEIFEQYKPTVMLVFTLDPLFRSVMNLNPPCADTHEIYGLSFCRVGKIDNWCWYRRCPNSTE